MNFESLRVENILGNPGSFGVVVLAKHAYMRTLDEDGKEICIAVKITNHENSFLNEWRVLNHLSNQSKNNQNTPFPRVYWRQVHYSLPMREDWNKVKEIFRCHFNVKEEEEEEEEEEDVSQNNLLCSVKSKRRKLYYSLGIQYIPGECLSDYNLKKVQRQGKLTKTFTQSLFFEMMNILYELYKSSIQHRDIARSNLILCCKKDTRGILSNPKLTLVDFGCSRLVTRQVDKIIDSPRVQLYYRPPEFIFISDSSSPVMFMYRSDCFSMALCFARTFIEFDNSSMPQTMQVVVEENMPNFVPEIEKLHLANHLWQMYLLMGTPKQSDIHIFECSTLFKSILPIFQEYQHDSLVASIMKKNRLIISKLLEDKYSSQFWGMLHWNPNERFQCFDFQF